MRIQLIAVGTRMPGWIGDGYREYARRMPGECSLELVEIPLGRRTRSGDTSRAVSQEGERMLAAIPPRSRVVAMEEDGVPWSTQMLADHLRQWMQSGEDLCLLVGGPDGLAGECRSRAQFAWSLSNLTLPHPLVRLILAEQLYRAWTVLAGHPYHRR